MFYIVKVNLQLLTIYILKNICTLSTDTGGAGIRGYIPVIYSGCPGREGRTDYSRWSTLVVLRPYSDTLAYQHAAVVAPEKLGARESQVTFKRVIVTMLGGAGFGRQDNYYTDTITE